MPVGKPTNLPEKNIPDIRVQTFGLTKACAPKLFKGTGGDVDCFAGDAILIVYETERLWERTGDAVRDSIRGPDGGPPGKLTLATMAASQCGGRLLNKLSPYHFSDGETDSTLTLHGSIGAGSIRTVDIGGTTDQVKGGGTSTFFAGESEQGYWNDFTSSMAPNSPLNGFMAGQEIPLSVPERVPAIAAT